MKKTLIFLCLAGALRAASIPIPPVTGNAGAFLSTDGIKYQWSTGGTSFALLTTAAPPTPVAGQATLSSQRNVFEGFQYVTLTTTTFGSTAYLLSVDTNGFCNYNPADTTGADGQFTLQTNDGVNGIVIDHLGNLVPVNPSPDLGTQFSAWGTAFVDSVQVQNLSNGGLYLATFDNLGNLMEDAPTGSGVSILTGTGTSITWLQSAVYAATLTGTLYTVGTTSAAVTGGTTSPSLTLAVAGTYLFAPTPVEVVYNGATITTQTITLAIRRSNNTPATLATYTFPLPVATTSGAVDCLTLPGLTYTTAGTTDVVTIFANLSATVSGSVQIGLATGISAKSP